MLIRFQEFQLARQKFHTQNKLARSPELAIFTLGTKILTWIYLKSNQGIKMSFGLKIYIHMIHWHGYLLSK